MARLIRAQEDERRRIARDLHDHLGQQITALRLRLHGLMRAVHDREELRGQVEVIDRLAGEMDRDLNVIAWELRPAALDDLGLVSAIDRLVRQWSGIHEIAATFVAHVPDRDGFAPAITTGLYRITQEALNNVLKHARATSVAVELSHADGEITLTIRDNGDGFDRALLRASARDACGGLGLIGMEERAALAGGVLAIQTAPGHGTTVIVRIPASTGAD